VLDDWGGQTAFRNGEGKGGGGKKRRGWWADCGRAVLPRGKAFYPGNELLDAVQRGQRGRSDRFGGGGTGRGER